MIIIVFIVEKCLSRYINDITDNDIYLDVYYTMDLECSEHEISSTKVPQSIQECCGNCVIESEKNCKLCGKSLYQGNEMIMKQFKLCSDCYLISSELIESTLVKKQISIFYLSWWDNKSWCDICDSGLTFTSDCQKYCAKCFIFYVGCRYCLTTNILFGPMDQSQCKKCKRISPINSGLDDFLFNNNLVVCNGLDYLKLAEFENIVKNINKYFIQREILESIFKEKKQAKQNKWIPYSQFKDVKEMTKGGYGIIYKATWSNNKKNKNETVILKRFENSKNIGKYFLNELKSCDHCFKDKGCHIIETYGFTKDPELEDYILVMEYATGGDLHKHLQKDFASITWNKEKLRILHQISIGLKTIHNKKFIHRDFHSGNILFDPKEDTPECYANLMKSCWDADPKKRPSIKDIRLTFGRWTFKKVNEEEFEQAEAKRMKLIGSKMIGPEFAEKRHPEAIYTSRPLSALISKCSSIYSSSTISFDKQDSNYISEELELDIDIKSLSQNLSSTIQNLDSSYISTELELDINTERSQNLSSAIQNFSTSLEKRRNVEFLNVEPHDNSGKRIKTNLNYP
ncbi:uncharacterized protein OCT59_016204 [Rhizophagus irregularis]|uniref:uncharacterized protein n=1 Tax=Rhizophagus irregularis TaxID=588596 RepID=UPI00331B3D10|nr:hypothetical protein OCT59_016204 [Rhizophagus irregularis]